MSQAPGDLAFWRGWTCPLWKLKHSFLNTMNSVVFQGHIIEVWKKMGMFNT